MIFGTTVVAALPDGAIRVWDILSRRVRRTFQSGPAHTDDDACWRRQKPGAVSPDGRLLAMCGWNMCVWDIGTGERVATLASRSSTACAFSPDGGLIASGFAFSEYEAGVRTRRCHEIAQVWDVASGARRRDLEGDVEEWDHPAITAVAFSPDGKLLAAGGANHSIVVFDVATGQRVHHLTDRIRGRVNAIAFSPDGLLLASDWGLWDLTDPHADPYAVGRPKRDVLTIAGDPLAFSSDGQLVACGGKDDNSIRLHDRWSGRVVQTLAGRGSEVRSIAFLPGDTTLAAEYADDVIRLWDARSGQEAMRMSLQGSAADGAE